MSDLIDTTEMYLKTIFELEEEGIVPLRARIAERLHQSGPTVSQTVARMERDGLLRVEGDRHLELSPEGREIATQVMRKHRLVECLLTDVLKLPWPQVHDEACRWEHVVSEDAESRLSEVLSSPSESPYGNPIPELGASPGDSMRAFRDGVRALPGLLVEAGSSPVRVVVRRITEELQKERELLSDLEAGGVLPGREVVVERGGLGLRLTPTDGGPGCELVEDAGNSIWVSVP